MLTVFGSRNSCTGPAVGIAMVMAIGAIGPRSGRCNSVTGAGVDIEVAAAATADVDAVAGVRSSAGKWKRSFRAEDVIGERFLVTKCQRKSNR